MSLHAVKIKDRYYILKDITKNGKHSTTTVEKLGTAEEIIAAHGCDDAKEWARQRAPELDMKDREAGDPEGRHFILARDNVRIPKGSPNSFNVGYLPLQKIYYDLRFPSICNTISKQHSFDFDLDAIFSRLIYSQILFPGSKLRVTDLSKRLFEHPDFEYHQVLRALSVISEHFDDIQSSVFKNSLKVIDRKAGVVFYDCTNYYFEIEREDEDLPADDDGASGEMEEKRGLRKYGKSKEHKPAPIVQVGLLMDLTGLPIAIIVTSGSRNEQTTMVPIEKKILKDYGIHDFIICTDSGLSSEANRKFNNCRGRAFITTVSIKKMSAKDMEWCLSPAGWHMEGEDIEPGRTYDITKLDETEESRERYYDEIFYKEKYIESYDEERGISFNQTLLVTFSLKYRDYTAGIRRSQVERAQRAIAQGGAKLEKKNQNDFRRFVKAENTTKNGEKATNTKYLLNEAVIEEEARFDGFYAAMHNLEEAQTSDVLKIMKGRWEIEESFRITKTQMRARPIYLARKDRICAHLLVVFIALLFYRILERKLAHPYTDQQIMDCLRGMYIAKYPTEDSYHPAYERTDLTDDIHQYLGFNTDYERMTDWRMRGNCRITKGTSKRKKDVS